MGETLEVFRSSSFAERGFCRRCGSHIYHRPIDGPELAISAGLVDNHGFEISREIFFDAKPSWYEFVAGSKKQGQLGLALEWGPRLLFRRIKRALGL